VYIEGMYRIDMWLPEEDKNFLKTVNEITISEHIRRAVKEYIQKLKNINVSTSMSEEKGGEL